MFLRKFNKLAIVTSLSVGSFLAGSYYERKRFESPLNVLKLINNQSLPIFETVLAATPISQPPPTTTTTQSNTTRISHIMKYGFPSLDNIRSFDNYVLSYDKRNRIPNWVFEHLTAEIIKPTENVDRSLCDFKADESIHPYFRSQNSDYLKSGYDRGHMAAAGNHRCNQKLVEQTFYLSNMAPQVGVGFNRDSWNRLERHVRKLTKKHTNVYVCTGPLYLPRKETDGKNYVKYEVIGANHVSVPTHFFKVVVYETVDGQLEMESYVMPNQKIDDSTPLTSFQVPPESIEKAAGLLFFDNVSRSKISKINGKKN